MGNEPGLFSISGLPSWRPDETAYSLFSRYHILSGNTLAAHTAKQLFGEARHTTLHDFPCQLDEFVQRTNGLLGSQTDIIFKHTLLRFYLPFRSGEDEATAIAAMRGSGIGSLKYRLGLVTSRFRANHPLKACLLCMQDDLNRYSSTYWRVSHQYPGVWICHMHGCVLHETTVKTNGVGRFLWYLPDPEKLRVAVSAEAFPELHNSYTFKLASLARLIRGYVDSSEGFRFDVATLLRVYDHALEERSLKAVGGPYRWKELGEAFTSFTSPLRSVSEFVAFPSTADQAIVQLGRLLRPPRTGTHPLRHLILINWLFDDWNNFLKFYQSLANESRVTATAASIEPFSATKKPDERKIKLSKLLLEDRVSISRAARNIGVDTTTAMSWAAEAGIVITRRPKLLKVEIREQLLDDLKSGMDKTVAAEKYLISIQTITTLLRTEVGLHHLWSAARKERERHAARQKWQAATGEAGMLGTKVIRSIVPAAYAWLYRNDRVWLQAHLPEREKQAVNHASVSWDQRDSDLAQLVERAGLVLRSRNGGKRLHLWELSQHVPDLRAKLSALHRLPLTKRAIQLALAMPSTSYFQEQELF